MTGRDARRSIHQFYVQEMIMKLLRIKGHLVSTETLNA